MPKGRLAAVVIARDEEDRLPGTLASVSFADEVIVMVDAASKDRTAEVARGAGALAACRPFDGFGPQKNAAIALASSGWILSLDADEVVTPELAREIREVLAKEDEPGAPRAYRVPIRLEFLGRRLRFGRDTLVRPVRLFSRGSARFSEDPVHERLLVEGKVGALASEMLHRSYRDLSHYLEKLDRYTTLASVPASARPSARAWGALLSLRVAWELLDRSILRLGFLDGAAGLTWAGLSAASTLLKALKARERARVRALEEARENAREKAREEESVRTREAARERGAER